MLRFGFLLLIMILIGNSRWVAAQERIPPKTLRWTDRTWIEPTRQLISAELRTRFTRSLRVLQSEDPGTIDYTRAIDELQALLVGPQDCFLSSERSDNAVTNSPPEAMPTAVSLRTIIEHVLSELSDKGREYYELKYGSEAAASLKAALADERIDALEETARCYVMTKAGLEAANRLASYYLEVGRTLDGARMIERIRLRPQSVSDWEPSLSLKNLVLKLQTQQHFDLAKDLEEFANRPAFQVDKKLPKEWKQQLVPTLIAVGQPRRTIQPLSNWTHFLGDAAHTAVPESVGVTDEALWEMDTLLGAGRPTEAHLQKYRCNPKDFDRDEFEYKPETPTNADEMLALMTVGHELMIADETSGRTIGVPASYPLVVGDVVVFRTLGRVRAVDLKSGRTLWDSAASDPAFADLFASGAAWQRLFRVVQQKNYKSPLTAWHQSFIESRTRRDHTVGTMSTDGQRVFFLDACGVANPSSALGIHDTKGNLPKSWNRLCAIDLKTGKALWEVGAPESGAEVSRGDFFLGVPTVVNDRLYALAENKDDVRLMCLDPATGATLWADTMCHSTMGQTVVSEALRRVAGMSPVLCQNWLICPTTSGYLMAYDLSQRRWAWCFGYDSLAYDADDFERQGLPFRRVDLSAAPRLKFDNLMTPQRWSESSLHVAGSKLIFASIDSDLLYCIDALTGADLWKNARQGGQYVAGVFGDIVVVVGEQRVQGLNLASSEVQWTLSLDDFRAAGRGIIDGTNYVLPVAKVPSRGREDEPVQIHWESQVWTIDVKSGTRVAQSSTSPRMPLGNLVAGNGYLVSQALDRVRAFPTVRDVATQLDQRLATNPRDASALARRGRLKLRQQQEAAGLEDLRASLQIQADPAVLETLINTSFARWYQKKVTLAEMRQTFETIKAPEEAFARLARIEIDELLQKKEYVAAFQRGIELMRVTSGRSTKPTDEVGDVSRYQRRGPASLLTRIYRQAAESGDGTSRAALDRLIEDRFQSAMTSAGARELTRFVDEFGWHPKSLEARWELAVSNRFKGMDEFLPRERQALVLTRHSDANIAAPATLALLALWIETEHRAANRTIVDQWRRRFAGFKLNDGSAYEDKLQELVSSSGFLKLQRVATWNGVPELRKSEATQVAPRHELIPMLGPTSPALIGHSIGVETSGPEATAQRQLVLRDELGREQWQIPLLFGGTKSLGTAPVGNFSQGHLLAMFSAGRLAVLDLSRSSPRPLWNRDVVDQAALSRDDSSDSPTLVNRSPNRWQMTVSQRQRVDYWGAVDAVTSECIVTRTDRRLNVFDSLTGQLLWSRQGVKPQARVLADDEYVVVHGSDMNTTSIFKLHDGELVASRPMAEVEPMLTTAGRDIVLWDEFKDHHVLCRKDAITNRDVWRLDFSSNSIPQVIDHDTIAVLKATGEFQLIDVTTGKAWLTSRLPSEPLLRNFLIVPNSRGYMVMTETVTTVRNRERRQVPTPNRDFNQIRGRASFIKTDGTLVWSTPVTQQNFVLCQPRECPLLIFRRVSHVRVVENGNVPKRESELLVLNALTGEVLIDESLPLVEEGELVELRPQEREVRLQLGKQVQTFEFQPEE